MIVIFFESNFFQVEYKVIYTIPDARSWIFQGHTDTLYYRQKHTGTLTKIVDEWWWWDRESLAAVFFFVTRSHTIHAQMEGELYEENDRDNAPARPENDR